MKDIHRLFELKDTPATILNGIMLNLYGTEYIQWDTDTIREEINDLFSDQKDFIPNEFCIEKLNAIRSLIGTTQYYDNWMFFEKITNALNEEIVGFDVISLADANEIVWSIIEANINDELRPFQKNVNAYISFSFKQFGLLETPKILRPIWDEYIIQDRPDKIDNGNQKKLQEYIDLYCKYRIKKIIDYSDIYMNKPIDPEDLKKDLKITDMDIVQILSLDPIGIEES